MVIMCKFAILGMGKIGLKRKGIIHNIDSIDLVGSWDPYDVSLNDQYASPQDIFNDINIDAVFICTTNNLLKDLTIQALQAGKHVFCEKPPAFTAAEVEEIQQAERDSGKILMYGFNHRQHGAVKKMKNIVDTGDYGKLLWMRGRYGKSVDDDFFTTWRADKELAGGGILLDQGIHMLDLFLHLGGSFDEVKAFISTLYWKLDGIEDNVFAIMKNNKTGLVASLHSTMTQWRHLFSLEVFMESGYMVLNGLRTSSQTYGEEVLTIARNRTKAPAATWEDEERFVFDVDTSMDQEVQLFKDAITSGKNPSSGNSDDARNVMMLVDAIYENSIDTQNGTRSSLI